MAGKNVGLRTAWPDDRFMGFDLTFGGEGTHDSSGKFVKFTETQADEMIELAAGHGVQLVRVEPDSGTATGDTPGTQEK